MDPDAIFFFALLAAQLVFSGVVIVVVPRSRIPSYRLIAPAAVPILLFAFAAFARWQLASSANDTELARMFVAYIALWLFGVLWATLLVRLRPLLRR